MSLLQSIASRALPALLVCALATPVLANGYCDSRQTQRDVDNCYRVNVEAQQRILDKNYNEVINHPKLPAANRGKLEQNQNEWANSVNSQCRDNACMLSSLENRNSQLRQLYRELQGPAAATPAPKKAEATPRISLDQLKVAIRKDHKYDISFGQAPNQSHTALEYAGLVTYRGQQYVIPSTRIVEIIPTYIHKGEVGESGDPKIPGGFCSPVDGVCKDSNNETLGVLSTTWSQLKRQNLIPSDVVPDTVSAPAATATATASQQASKQAAKLYCSNASETCTLTINGKDLELTRAELPKHTGFYQGDRSDCIAEACWGNKGEFLGLNPDYYRQ